MNTCEMVLKADMNGNTYCNCAIRYNKILGFHDRLENTWPLNAFSERGLNGFCHMSGWQIYEPEYTMDELFVKIGHRFKIK